MIILTILSEEYNRGALCYELSTASSYFTPLKYKYSPQHLVLIKNGQFVTFPECRAPSFKSIEIRGKMIVLYV
jgi:hypothetical protein